MGNRVQRPASVCSAVVACVLALLCLNPTARAQATTMPAVSVSSAPSGVTVPTDFLGLSFDVSVLPRISQYATQGNLVSLLKSLGPSGILRFGGNSVDQDTAWTMDGTLPAWASSSIGPSDLTGLASLARQTGWKIALAVGLGHYDPAAAAQEAAAAHSILGTSLAGIEIGNEPDEFPSGGLRSTLWDLPQYLSEVASYKSAITAAAPGVAIEGPDVGASLSGLAWLQSYAASQQPPLLTAHYYPLASASCGGAPTIGDLVSPLMAQQEATRFALLKQIGTTTGVPIRLSEANDASCGGQPGVSNTFASAIWLTQFLAVSTQAGFVGVNLHDAPADCSGYSALCTPTQDDAEAGAMTANPKWYALRLFAQLVGSQRVSVDAQGLGGNLAVYAYQSSPTELKYLLTNASDDPASTTDIRLQLACTPAGAESLALTAPALSSTSGLSLNGSPALASSSWDPRPLPSSAFLPNALAVSVPNNSMQVVTVHCAAAASAAGATTSLSAAPAAVPAAAAPATEMGSGGPDTVGATTTSTNKLPTTTAHRPAKERAKKLEKKVGKKVGKAAAARPRPGQGKKRSGSVEKHKHRAPRSGHSH